MNLPSPTFVISSFALVFSAACSDPPSPPAQGAVAETISPNAMGGCTPAGPPFAAPPLPDAISGTAATLNCDTSNPGCKPDTNVVVDGDQGASVSCSVTGGGSSFQIQASLSQGIVALNVLGTIAATGGKVTLSSSHAGFTLRDDQCDLVIAPGKGSVKPGAIWAHFDCEHFADPTIATPPGCAAIGTFIFENCSQ